MRSNRIVLLSNRSILVTGVERLLRETDGVALTVVPTDTPDMIRRIKALTPQAIVLDSGDTALDQSVVTRMLEECPKARVIALNLNRKDIAIYQMTRILQTDLATLLDAVRGRTATRKGRVARKVRNQEIDGKGGES